MLLLSQITNTDGQAMTPVMAIDQLRTVENVMSARGWPVIGSLYKASKLHPWKAASAQQLHDWAQVDLAQYRANSLNLRLSDHKIIALDCDFNDAELMRAFCDGARRLLVLEPEQIYTCTAKKGGKLFFRRSTRYDKGGVTHLPKLVGYTKGHSGDSAFKQELELKTDLSTVAGFHSVTNSGEIVLYSGYRNYPYIIHAKPEDLAPITGAEIMLLQSLFNRLLIERGFVDERGEPIEHQAHHELVRSCAALFLAQAIEAGGANNLVVEFSEQVRPMLSDFELYDAADVISAVAYKGKWYDARLKPDVDLLQKLYQADDVLSLRRMGGGFEVYFKHVRSKLLARALRRGISLPSKIVMCDAFSLYHFMTVSGILSTV